MASSGKKKTTMAKLMRESKLRERRLDKQAKKDARKLASANGSDWLADGPNPMGGEPAQPDAAQPDLEPVAQAQPEPASPQPESSSASRRAALEAPSNSTSR